MSSSSLSLALVALPAVPLFLYIRQVLCVERERRLASSESHDERTVRVLASAHGFGLQGVRRHFHLDFAFTQLNHASYGCAPYPVMAAAQASMLAIEAYPDRFMRREDQGQAQVRAACDSLAGALLGAPPGSCAFVENATAGVNAVLRSLRLQPGDVMVLTDHTYNACKNAVLDVSERCGVRVVTHSMSLPLQRGQGGKGSYEDGIVEDYQKTLQGVEEGKLAFCLLDHITSPTAIQLPVARLVQACRRASSSVLVMVDGAHAPGMVPGLCVPALGCDWYVGNLHKWCFAAKGVALLHAADSVRESATQGSIISHFWRRPFAQRFFMQGTLDYSRALSAPAALGWVQRELGGWGAMQGYNTALAAAGAAVLAEAWGCGYMLEPQALLRSEGLTTPFLAVVVTPLHWRQWGQGAGGEGLEGLPEAEALAALQQDEGLSERISCAVLAHSSVQSVFYKWELGGQPRVMCRIAAQVYNTLEDYHRLAAAVLAVHKARAGQ